jgi:hypothetical protein
VYCYRQRRGTCEYFTSCSCYLQAVCIASTGGLRRAVGVAKRLHEILLLHRSLWLLSKVSCCDCWLFAREIGSIHRAQRKQTNPTLTSTHNTYSNQEHIDRNRHCSGGVEPGSVGLLSWFYSIDRSGSTRICSIGWWPDLTHPPLLIKHQQHVDHFHDGR